MLRICIVYISHGVIITTTVLAHSLQGTSIRESQSSGGVNNSFKEWWYEIDLDHIQKIRVEVTM